MTAEQTSLGPKRANWQAAILVCRKCQKRMGDRGFGPAGRTRLAKALTRRVKQAVAGAKVKGRAAPVGIVEVGCLKLCPRGGVTVVVGSKPGCWLVAKPGLSADTILDLAGVSLSPN
jgi:predicted metal-binding protein